MVSQPPIGFLQCAHFALLLEDYRSQTGHKVAVYARHNVLRIAQPGS